MVLVDGFRFGKDATSALRQKALPLHGFLVFLAPQVEKSRHLQPGFGVCPATIAAIRCHPVATTG